MLSPSIKLAKDIANSMNVPPQPEVLMKVSKEAKSNNPNFKAIGESIKADVGLSSALLQVVNSPFYGLRNKVTSIDHAISLLGVPRVERVITTVSMRAAVSGNLNLGRFWDSASEIANISCHLARKLSGVDQDDAYSIGLFHDCGIPIMMQKFKDYKQTLKEINKRNINPQTRLEDKRYKCNHAVVGYCLCEKWFLPPHIARAVLLHHENFKTFEPDSDEDDMMMSLLSLLKMSEYISDVFRQSLREQDSLEWDNISGDILAFLGLTEDDFQDIKEDVLEQLDQEGA